MSLKGAVLANGNRRNWPAMQLRGLVDRSKATGRADLPLLGVSVAGGVRERWDGDGRPAASDDLSGYKLVEPGDIVMNALGKPHGSIGSSPLRGITSPAYWVMTVKPSTDSRFLHYLLRSGHMVSEYQRLGKNQPPNQFDISWHDFRSIRVPVPPLAEQRIIADYLDRETARIDTLIEEQQRLIDLLRERREGVVTKAFLDAVTEERSLKYVVEEVTVGIVVQPSRWYVDAGIPALRGVNVKRGSISLADVVYISDEGHSAHSKSQLRAGDVVVVRTGQAGAAAKIPAELDGANAIDILIVRPGEHADADFLVWYLNSQLAAARIQHGSVGAIQGHFNVGALRELPLPYLPLAEQRRIVPYLDDRIAKIDTTVRETERFIELSRERRAALITAAVTGQIDVRDEVA